MPRRVFALVWMAFWLLLATVAVQDHLRQGHRELWRPLLAEGSSALVATVLVTWLWQLLPRLDPHLTTPWRWLRWPLVGMLPIALGFVLVVQALRHAAHGAIGQPYVHDPWPQLLSYEMAKFCIFYVLFAAVLFGLRSHAAMRAERERALLQAALAREAQLAQLAQQIEPHFLFNALNTIAATVHESADLADELIGRLATLLRASMAATQRPVVPLADEVALARAYGAIMLARFGPRVQLHFDVAPPALPCQVPVLLLQPLIENAFRHGVERVPGPAVIHVRATREVSRLALSVRANVGVLDGCDAAAAEGLGLTNLRARLALVHGDAARLELRPCTPSGTEAWVEMPCGC